MGCSSGNEFLHKYFDGEADALERIVVENHILFCPECGRSYADMQRISGSLLQLGRNLEYPRELQRLSSTAAVKLTNGPGVVRTLAIIAANSTRYVGFIPGAPRAAAAVRRGMRAAPKAAWGLTSHLVKGGARLAQSLL